MAKEALKKNPELRETTCQVVYESKLNEEHDIRIHFALISTYKVILSFVILVLDTE